MEAPESADAAALATFVERVVDRDLDALAGETTLVDADDQPAPAERIADLAADADAIVAVVPVAAPALLDLVRENDADARAVIVVTGDARDRLGGLALAVVRSAFDDREGALYGHDGDAPVGVLLIDDRAVVAGFGDGQLRGLLVSDAPEVRRWAQETCERYRDAADPLT